MMGHVRDIRARAIEGLRMIAALEEYVAGEIDEPGYFGEMAELLRLSASDRQQAVARLSDPTSGRKSGGHRRDLRLVRGEGPVPA